MTVAAKETRPSARPGAGASRGEPNRVPNQKQIDTSTYGGRLAVRIRELREARGWTVTQLADMLKVPVPSMYAYERGRAGGGVDMPLNLFPAVAKAFGFATANGWLPKE